MSAFRPSHLAISVLALALAACGGANTEYSYPDANRAGKGDLYEQESKLFGEDGLSLFGGSDDEGNQGGGGSGIAVNSFLWRASLDTISYMPLTSADPFGGVIITDWYTPPDAVGERVKLQIYILDRQLRSDGLRVSAFREQRDQSGNWLALPVSARTVRQIEDAILSRARELRVKANRDA